MNKQYVKKTMIFKQDHLDIINGIARQKHMQIKDVLEQLLEYSINNISYKEEARKLGEYLRKSEKKIYFRSDFGKLKEDKKEDIKKDDKF